MNIIARLIDGKTVRRRRAGKNLFPVFAALCFTLICLFPYSAFGAAGDFYYIQVGSFKTEERARELSNELQALNYETVIRYTEVSASEFWNRVYIGPYGSRVEADSAALVLRKKGLFTGQAIIISRPSLLFDKFQEKPTPEMAVQPLMAAPEQKAEPVAKETTLGPATKEAPSQEAAMAAVATQQTPEEHPPQSIDTQTSTPSQSVIIKKGLNKGLGRNLREGSFALSLKHSYIEMDTEIAERKRITDIDSSEVAVTPEIKHGFPASFHMTMLQARFGLTDFVELYADVGANYDFESTEPRHVYGLGLRQNLLETDFYHESTLYFAFQADFHKGQFEEDYKSNAGDTWNKSSDWREVMLKLEGGLIFNRLILFGGGNYLDYRETTTRKQLENLPAPYTSYRYEDELEEKEHWGFFAGAEYHLTQHSVVNVEGNLHNRDSVSISYEYRF